VTRRAVLLFVLLIGSLAGWTLTGRSLFLSLSVLFIGILLLSWVWSWLSLRGVRFERTARTLTSQVGRVFEESLRLENDSFLPKLWVEVEDHSALPGIWATARALGLSATSVSQEFAGHRASAVASGLKRHQTWLWSARTICTRRGRFPLGPVILRSGDPFGFFPAKRSIGQRREVVVLPATVRLPSFPIPAGRLPGGEALRRRTYQVTPNASGVRDYAPGDSFNRIHWKSTARRGRLISKEFELDPMADVWLILDGNRSVHLRSEGAEELLAGGLGGAPVHLPPWTEEYMVAAAASIALNVLGRNRATGLLGYGNGRLVVQPERGEAQLFRILEALAGFRAEGEVDLTDVFRIETPWFPRGATVVVVSPNVRQDLLHALTELKRRGLTPIMVMVDPGDFGNPISARGLSGSLANAGIAVRIAKRGMALDASIGATSPGQDRERAA
jgi:uncharacterized protein (DUF58 family)